MATRITNREHSEIVGGLKRDLETQAAQLLAVNNQKNQAIEKLNEQNAKVADLEKKLAEKDSHVKMYQGMSSDRDKVINRLHDILDLLPGVIDRNHENGYTNIDPEKRLTTWIIGVAFAKKIAE